jgi:hypothetical protein
MLFFSLITLLGYFSLLHYFSPLHSTQNTPIPHPSILWAFLPSFWCTFYLNRSKCTFQVWDFYLQRSSCLQLIWGSCFGLMTWTKTNCLPIFLAFFSSSYGFGTRLRGQTISSSDFVFSYQTTSSSLQIIHEFQCGVLPSPSTLISFYLIWIRWNQGIWRT